MIRLSEKYADRPAAELPLLFQRILSNATMDWFRRQKVRNQVVRNFSEFETGRRRRRFRYSRDARGARRAAPVGERRRLGFTGADLANDRGRGGAAAGPSTRGVSPALLGGTRCRRDRRLDGVFGRERQDALLAGRACLGEGPQGEGNHDMKTRQLVHDRRPRGARSRASRARVAACLSESARDGRARRRRAAPLRPREVARDRAAARARRDARRRRHRLGRRHRRLQPVALVAALRLGAAAGRPGRRPGPDPGLAERGRRSRSPPRSTRPCSATTCRSTPTAIPVSRSS